VSSAQCRHKNRYGYVTVPQNGDIDAGIDAGKLLNARLLLNCSVHPVTGKANEVITCNQYRKIDFRTIIDLNDFAPPIHSMKYVYLKNVHTHLINVHGRKNNISYNRYSVLFLLHNLENQGAPLAAYAFITLLRNYLHFDVNVLSPSIGPLHSQLVRIGCNVHVGRTFNPTIYDIIYVNTIIDWFHHPNEAWLEKTIWWVHESMTHLMTSWVVATLPKAAHRIFVTSRSMEVYRGAIPDHNNSVIENMANYTAALKAQVSSFTLRKHLHIPETAVVFIQIGTINRIRGQHMFVAAGLALCTMFHDVYIIVVGATDNESYKSHITKSVRNHKCRKNFVFTGPASHGKTLKYLAIADVLVSLSYYESFGMTLLEGMTMGKPIIVAKRDGVPDVVYQEAIDVELHIQSVLAAMVCMMNETSRMQHAFKSLYRAAYFSPSRILIKHLDIMEAVRVQSGRLGLLNAHHNPFHGNTP